MREPLFLVCHSPVNPSPSPLVGRRPPPEWVSSPIGEPTLDMMQSPALSSRVTGANVATGILPSALRMLVSSPPDLTVPNSLRHRRERAERNMNALRAAVLVVLAMAAAVYSSTLSPALNRANVMVLTPALTWTLLQYLAFYSRDELPSWLPLANAVVDVTAVTAIIAAYATADSALLALRSPIYAMYFVVLAARPVASSVRKAAIVAALIVAEYGALVMWLVATGQVTTITNPVLAVKSGAVSPLDEAAKLMILAVAGVLATYATRWVEHLVKEASKESEERQRVGTRLVQAELDTLRLQLNPHFLFNALNSAMALVTSSPVAAEKMISELSDFLRLVLNGSSEQEVTLDRELSLLHRYIGIQRVRFQDKLVVNFDIGEDLGGALVPSLLLQPLVENAIRHGVGPRASGGTVSITAKEVDSRLEIRIVDDGVGPAAKKRRDQARGTSLGLENTATRLKYMYHGAHQFEAGARPEGGYAVRISLPLRFSSLFGDGNSDSW